MSRAPAAGERARAARDLLARGELTDLGRIPGASNDTRLVLAALGPTVRRAVYKPISGERPLHDFPAGSLAGREAAAAVLDAQLGTDVVPPTVLRADAPLGPGSLQAYVEPDPDAAEPVGVFAPAEVPAGWAPVFAAQTEDGAEVLVAHAPWERLRALAFFDALANNADRKASHIVAGDFAFSPAQPRLWAIDNGLCFHAEDKVRTVLWGFAGAPLSAAETAATQRAADPDGAAARELAGLLAAPEIAALQARARALLAAGALPEPPAHRYPIPWPPL